MALSHLYTERNDAEAFGILLQMIDPTFVLVSLMLTDILGCVRRLTLWLQKSPSKANITDLLKIVKLVVDELNCLLSDGLGNRDVKFTLIEFERMMRIVDQTVESVPLSTRLRAKTMQKSLSHDFEEFKKSTFKPFVMEFSSEIQHNIKVDRVSAAFCCLYVKYFPRDSADLSMHGLEDINILVEHFGAAREGHHPKTLEVKRLDPLLNRIETLQEYEIFKTVAYELRRKQYVKMKASIHALEVKLKSTLSLKSNESKISQLKEEKVSLENKLDNMSLQDLYKELSEAANQYLFPSVMTLLEMALICPVGNSTVERLFSQMKLTKTRLRNCLGDDSLDALLRIKTECKDKLTDVDLDELVQRFKYCSTELSASGEIRIDI